MKYTMKAPCSSCPFLRGEEVGEGKPVRLTEGRIDEITSMMLDGGRGDFQCHKTVEG